MKINTILAYLVITSLITIIHSKTLNEIICAQQSGCLTKTSNKVPTVDGVIKCAENTVINILNASISNVNKDFCASSSPTLDTTPCVTNLTSTLLAMQL